MEKLPVEEVRDDTDEGAEIGGIINPSIANRKLNHSQEEEKHSLEKQKSEEEVYNF